MVQAHATYFGKLRKCGLEGMGRFLSDLLHELNTYVLSSGQGTLVAPYALGDYGPTFLLYHFLLKTHN